LVNKSIHKNVTFAGKGDGRFYYYSENQTLTDLAENRSFYSTPKLTIFPNPSKGIITISGLNNSPANIAVFYMQGAKILETYTNGNNSLD